MANTAQKMIIVKVIGVKEAVPIVVARARLEGPMDNLPLTDGMKVVSQTKKCVEYAFPPGPVKYPKVENARRMIIAKVILVVIGIIHVGIVLVLVIRMVSSLAPLKRLEGSQMSVRLV